MNFRSQGNIARTISKVSLQPRHLEIISTYEISQGNNLSSVKSMCGMDSWMDSFEQFCTVKRCVKRCVNRCVKNCEETAKFSKASPRELNFDDAVTPEVASSSLVHPAPCLYRP